MSVSINKLIGSKFGDVLDKTSNCIELSDFYNIFSYSKKMANKAVCFKMGDVGDISHINCINELCILPFENCWFEFTQSDKNKQYQLNVFVHVVVDKGVTNAFIYVENKTICGLTYVGSCRIPDLRQGYVVVYDNSSERIIDLCIGCVRNFCSALNCSNVEKKKNVIDKKINDKRIKNGKLPIVEFYTLQIKKEFYDKNLHAKGSHASPRVHLRRGHFRRTFDGKCIWVQPCIVGDKDKGMINKDYRLPPPAVSGALLPI